MALVQFEIDEESENALNALIESFEGDRNTAFKSLLLRHSFEVTDTIDEDEMDRIEADHEDVLRDQLARAEAGFAAVRYTSWEEVKRRAGL